MELTIFIKKEEITSGTARKEKKSIIVKARGVKKTKN